MMLAAFMRAKASGASAAGRRDPVPARRRGGGQRARRRRSSCASTPSCSTGCATRSASSAASRWTSPGGASTRSWSPRSRSAGRGRRCAGRPATARCRSAAARWPARPAAARAWTRSRLPVHVHAGDAADDRGDRRRAAAAAGGAAAGAAAAGADRPRCSTCSASAARLFDPLLHNTASATIVSGGEQGQRDPGRGRPLELDVPAAAGLDAGAALRGAASAVRRRARVRGRCGTTRSPAEPDMALFDDARRRAARARPRGAKPSRCCSRASPTGASSRSSASRPTASCRCSCRRAAVHAADPRRPTSACPPTRSSSATTRDRSAAGALLGRLAAQPV